MRILRLSRKMAQVDFANHINPSVVRLIKLLGKIVFAAHLLGCMWFLVDECEADGGDDLWQTCGGAGLGSKVRSSQKIFCSKVEEEPGYRKQKRRVTESGRADSNRVGSTGRGERYAIHNCGCYGGNNCELSVQRQQAPLPPLTLQHNQEGIASTISLH